MSATAMTGTPAGLDLPLVPVPGERLPAWDVLTVALCEDCVGAIAGSDVPPGDPDAVPLSALAGYQVDLVSDDYGDTPHGFAWSDCDGCGSQLGGERYDAQAWRRCVPALTMTDHEPRAGARSLVTSWDGSPRPSGYGNCETVRPAVELTVKHDKARKAYTVTLYAVEHVQRDGYALTRMTINLRGDGVLSAVRLATIPAARVSVKALATLRDEWRAEVIAALAGNPGRVSAEVAAWVRTVTA